MTKIGMRNVKTGIAVFLCIVILKIFGVQYSFYACIAAVICMQSTIIDSFEVSKNRIIGTCIGGIIGLIFSMINPDNVVLTTVGIIIVIYILNIIGKRKSITIACIVFLAIMINLKEYTPLYYTVNRVIETITGIVIALLVNYFICPPKNKEKLDDMKNNIIKDIKFYYEINIEKKHNDEFELKQLEDKIIKYKNSVDTYLHEIRYNKKHAYEIELLRKQVSIFEQAYNYLFVLESFNCKNNTTNLTDEEFKIIYRYNVNQLSELILQLS